MASTRKSPPSSALFERAAAIVCARIPAGARVVAGLSGGIDSVVLLHVLRRIARRRRFELAAIHVNHQIHPAAAQWAKFCRKYCRELKVPLTVVTVKVARKASLEAAAREARYAAFAAVRADYVVLAHNLDDQAETVLLQLLRGAGVKGVSAMPVLRGEARGERREGKNCSPGGRLPPPASRVPPSILRPLLGVSRAEIARYAERNKLEWVDDDSNANAAFDRNFVRHRVLPVIEERYPAYRVTLARASRNFADAAELLDELAAIDIGGGSALALATLRSLSRARARNALRYLLGSHGLGMPSEVRLDECVRQAQQSRTGRFAVNLGSHELRAFEGVLHVVPKTASTPAAFCRRWQGEERLALPELGVNLIMKQSRTGGISAAKLKSAPVTVRVRSGGERLRPHAKRPRRSLKNLLQEARLPPWLRERLPLLYCGDSLVYVPGIGIDADFAADVAQPAFAPALEPYSC